MGIERDTCAICEGSGVYIGSRKGNKRLILEQGNKEY